MTLVISEAQYTYTSDIWDFCAIVQWKLCSPGMRHLVVF